MHPLLRSLALLSPLFAAAIRRADRRIQAELRGGQATSPERAMTFSPGSAVARWRLKRLIHGGVVHALDSERYYWDERGWIEYRHARRRRALTVLAAALIVMAILWWWGIVR